MPHTLHVRVRVGVFELDLSAGELRAINGAEPAERVVLAQQPLRVLSMLLERPGQLVSREEIQKELWPNDTVVEFEHSINAAIAKLRKAFGDSANEPSYIETIAKRGYRLIAPTEWLPDSGESPAIGILAIGNRAAAQTQLEPVGLAGRVVSHYRVLEIIGGGGMGVVYRAEDLKLGRAVALKFLPEELGDDARALERFEREARAASALDHPNICSIYEFGEHEGRHFIVMQLLEGETLRELLASSALRQPGPESGSDPAFPLDQLLHIANQIVDGLVAAHECGIIHRDIKPANIFVTKRGLVKILDFGVAKLVEAVEAPNEIAQEERSVSDHDDLQHGSLAENRLTRTGLALGTVGYMSPEQVRGEEVDTRTDIFSFGVVLYEMATGLRAFKGETAASVHEAILSQTPASAHELNAAIPPMLGQITNRAIEKDRNRRYQTAREMAADLQLLVAHPISDAHQVAPSKRHRWNWLAVAVAVVAVGAIAVGLYWRSHRTPRLTERDTIVLADFINTTGDPVFDDTLRQALSAQLSQSPFFNVLSDRKIRGALKELNHPASEQLTEDVAGDVCRHTASKAMVDGSILGFGKGYMLELKAVDCNTRDVLAETQEQARDKEAVLKALDEAAITVRKQMGEPFSSVRTYATPLAGEGSAKSLEAWKAYTMGVKIQYKDAPSASLPFLKRAVEIDPTFARAYASLSIVYGNLSEGQRAEGYARKAYELRDKVNQRERFAIEAIYYMGVTGDMDRAARTYELWQQNYRRDFVPLANLGLIYARLGKHEQAVEVGRESMRLQPNHAGVYGNLEFGYQYLNRLDEAEELLKQAGHHGITDDALLENWYELAFLKGDSVQMAQKTASGMGKPGIEDALLGLQADTDGWYGRYKRARKLTQQAMDSAERNDAAETAAVYQVDAALREAAAGNWQQARVYALGALKRTQSRDVKAMAALALALAHDAATSEKLADELDKIRPSDTMVQQYWLPTIRAAVALEQRDPNRAIEFLKGMGSIELGDTGVRLPSAYVRGQAYLTLGDGKAAAAELQKFIEHYGLVASFPWGALARLGLARAYALEAANDPAAREKARTAYQNFLTLWKGADPDIPIYKQAKAEYAKLQ